MPKRSNRFQRLITEIQRQLASRAVVTESKFLRDNQTKENVEVDIVIETTTNDFCLVISVEVRARKRKATVEWVREMLGKHRDLPTNKLVLVSQSGFTREALKKAKENNIDTVSFESAKIFDWSEHVRRFVELNPNTMALFNIVCDSFTIGLADPSPPINQEAHVTDSVTPRPISLEAYYCYPVKGEQLRLKELPGALLRNHHIANSIMNFWRDSGSETFKLETNLPCGAYIQPVGSVTQIPVSRVQILGHLQVRKSPISFRYGAFKNTQVTEGIASCFCPTGVGTEETASITIVETKGAQATGSIHFSLGNRSERKPITLYMSEHDANELKT